MFDFPFFPSLPSYFAALKIFAIPLLAFLYLSYYSLPPPPTQPLPPVPLSSSLSLYKGALIVMMVVGGRVHTGSFDREMSKCVSLCGSVSMSVCRCLTLRGQGADVISVCAWTVWPVMAAAGLALWP